MRTKPWWSSSTAPPSHSVRGAAPMKMKTSGALTSSLVPVLRSAIVMRSRWSAPWPAVTSALWRTSMFGVAPMRSTRYCDIFASSESPRTSMITRRAYCEKYMAAWPAELPAPTT